MKPRRIREEEVEAAARLLAGPAAIGPPGAADDAVRRFLAVARHHKWNPRNQWVVVEEGRIRATLLFFPQPGGTVHLDGPHGTAADPTSARARALVEAAIADARASGSPRLAVNLPEERTREGAFWKACGFRETARLLQMSRAVPPEAPAVDSRLRFEAVGDDPEKRDRFGAILVRTAIDSRDASRFPSAEDPGGWLAAVAPDAPGTEARWFLVYEADGPTDPVGGLVLTLCRSTAPRIPPRMDLRYMGLVPEARGKGYGHALVARTLAEAASAGASEVTVTVDGENPPALKAYEKAGFSVTGKTSAWLWTPEATS